MAAEKTEIMVAALVLMARAAKGVQVVATGVAATTAVVVEPEAH